MNAGECSGKVCKSSALIAFFLTIFLNETVSAHLYYVAAAGSDAASGTKDSPFKTIGAAAAEARAGDTVLVRGGDYKCSVRLVNSGTAEAPVTFMPEPGTGAVNLENGLTGQNSSTAAFFTIIDKSHIRIQGFYFKDSPYGYAVYMQNSKYTYTNTGVEGIVVAGNTFENIGIRDLTSRGYINAAVKVEFCGPDNYIQDNSFTSVHGCAILISNSTGTHVLRNTIVNELDKDADWDGNGKAETSYASGILITGKPCMYQCSGNIVAGNLIYDFKNNSLPGNSTGIWCDVQAYGVLIERNIIHDINAHGIYIEAACIDNIVRENISYRNLSGFSTASFYTRGAANTQWINNVAYANENSGFYVLQSQGDIFRNNISMNNGTSQIYVSDYAVSAGNITFENNLWFSEGVSAIAVWNDAGQYPFVDAELDFSQWTGISGETSGKSENPLFIDAGGGDFHLQPGSPARGAGVGGVDMGGYPEGGAASIRMEETAGRATVLRSSLQPQRTCIFDIRGRRLSSPSAFHIDRIGMFGGSLDATALQTGVYFLNINAVSASTQRRVYVVR